jgi:hypothetical protein
MKIVVWVGIVGLVLLPMPGLASYMYAEISGAAVYGDGTDTLDVNEWFDINIYLHNDHTITGWSTPFKLSGTGNVSEVDYGSVEFVYGNFMPQPFDCADMDGQLPDQFGIEGVILSGIPPAGEEDHLVIVVELQVLGDGSTTGEFCIDSGDCIDNTYDWLFDPPVSFMETCWPVKQYVPPPEDTLNIWADFHGPAIFGYDTINVNQPFYVDIRFNNDDFERSLWQTPFRFYGTGDITTLDSQDVFAEYTFASYCHETYEGWQESWDDGSLPDQICLRCVGTIPVDAYEHLAMRYSFIIQGDESTQGTFCVEKGDLINDDYDWLFEWPMPEFETVCLPVKMRVSSGLCGDARDDGDVNILDITYIIDYLYTGGPEPYNIRLADANGDCFVNILDVTYLVEYLYMDGPEPVCPPEWPCNKAGEIYDFIRIPIKR